MAVGRDTEVLCRHAVGCQRVQTDAAPTRTHTRWERMEAQVAQRLRRALSVVWLL